jgi:hypothetical protein
MCPMSRGSKRQWTFSFDTVNAIHWTSSCLISLCEHLLSTDRPYKHDYGLLGFYQQDDIERHFEHWITSTVKEIFSTNALDRAKFSLENNIDVSGEYDCHQCEL